MGARGKVSDGGQSCKDILGLPKHKNAKHLSYSTFPNSHSPHVDCGIENRALLIESNHVSNKVQGQYQNLLRIKCYTWEYDWI